jgi:xanthine/uracil permease
MTQRADSDRIVHAVDDKPGWGLSLLLGLTHVSLIFDGIIFLPIMIGKATATPPEQVAFVTFATILVAAVGTLIQTLRVGGRIGCGYVLFMGSYSAFLACTLSAVRMGGLELMATMTLLSAPVVFFYSYFLRFLRHIVTPQIGGIMIILVALSLMPIGIELWQGGFPDRPGFGSYPNYLVGLATMATLVLLMLFGTTTLRLWTPLLGLAAGCTAAWYFGILELEQFINAPWIGLPQWAWPGLELNLGLGHAPLLAAFIMAALVSSMEGTGNIMLVQQFSLRRFRKVDYQHVQAGLYGDAAAKALGGLCGAAPVATFCDNLPLLKMTRVASRRVGLMGAAILLALAFLPKISGFLLDLPAPVIGGMLVIICAMLFAAGIGLIIGSGLDFQIGLILGLSLCAGLVAETRNFFPQVLPVALAPMLQNGVAMGGFVAMFMSLLLVLFPKPRMTFRLASRSEEMPTLLATLEDARGTIRMSDTGFHRLRLACEETFSHLCAHIHDKDKTCLFDIQRREEGMFVEIICGSRVEDVDQSPPLIHPSSADEEELSRLGLFLLARTARDVLHYNLSGNTYITFFIDD